jgi:hypothetical protein
MNCHSSRRGDSDLNFENLLCGAGNLLLRVSAQQRIPRAANEEFLD